MKRPCVSFGGFFDVVLGEESGTAREPRDSLDPSVDGIVPCVRIDVDEIEHEQFKFVRFSWNVRIYHFVHLAIGFVKVVVDEKNGF